MMVKCQQNTHQKVELEWAWYVTNNNFFHKRNASIPQQSNLIEKKLNIQKLQHQTPRQISKNNETKPNKYTKKRFS